MPKAHRLALALRLCLTVFPCKPLGIHLRPEDEAVQGQHRIAVVRHDVAQRQCKFAYLHCVGRHGCHAWGSVTRPCSSPFCVTLSVRLCSTCSYGCSAFSHSRKPVTL